MSKKKRILFVTEFSELNTGFSNIAKSLIRRLYDTGKYEIAELGTYIKQSDPRIANVPWKVYAAIPEDNDQAGQQEYRKPHEQWGRQQQLGQFGAAVYDGVLLDFEPDYVCSWMDPWMSTIHMDSPFRKHFRWIFMPCIDSTPQRQEWLKMYETADYLMGYSDFAINVMKEQSPKIRQGGAKKLLPTPTRPGVDMDVFKPMDKNAVREKWGISVDLPIIGTVMRNQQRKLFCEILDSFAMMKKKNPNNETIQKAVFLIHSSGYDAGQEYWTHIARLSQMKYMPNYFEGFHKHILHTYQCDSCNKKLVGYAIWLLHAKMTNGRAYMKCPCCGNEALRTPNTNVGFTREEMAEVFNMMDLYVQGSIAGADEMPISEAKGCGVPVLVTANAAMKEKGMKPTDWEGNIMHKNADGTPYTMHEGGIAVNIAYEFHEAATMQRRCYFDRKDMAMKMKVIANPKKLKILSQKAVESIKDNCDYDEIAKRWEYVIDNLPAHDRTTTWDKEISPDEVPNLNGITIPNLPDEQFVDWCYTEILGSTVDVVGRQTWLESLAHGRPRQSIVEYFMGVATKDNKTEMLMLQYRAQKAHQEQMRELLKNENILQGMVL